MALKKIVAAATDRGNTVCAVSVPVKCKSARVAATIRSISPTMVLTQVEGVFVLAGLCQMIVSGKILYVIL